MSKINISKKHSTKFHKAVHRQALIDNGLYGAFQTKTVPSKKTYSRKGRTNLGGQD